MIQQFQSQRSRSKSKTALFYFIILLINLVIFEATTRIAIHIVFQIEPLYHAIESRINEGPGTDPFFRWKWVKDQAAKRKTEITYSFDAYDSELGWMLAKNVHSIQFNKMTVNSNSQGIRGIAEHSHQRIDKKIRIGIIGDSYTFGEGVNDDETYAAFIQKMLPNTEVLNFGVHGYGHDQILLHLRKIVSHYELDVIILGFAELDISRNYMYFRDYAKPMFELHNDQLKLTHVPVPTMRQMKNREFFHLKTLDILSLIMNKADPDLALTYQILKDIQKEIVIQGAIPVFAFINIQLPNPEIYKDQLQLEKEYLTIAQQFQYHPIATTPGFIRAMRNGVAISDFDHWDAMGHQVLAQEIVKGLRKQGLLKHSPHAH